MNQLARQMNIFLLDYMILKRAKFYQTYQWIQ